MASINISGYTFSTTSVPTTPALRVESGTGTYYVNLTTSQRPAALSYQKVFTVSTTNYSFLRPFVTSNSLTGYSGVSNNSTLTTGYSGVSNNSTVTTGYAGVSNNSTVTTGYSGVSNNSTVTTGYAGVSNNSTVTTGYSGVSRTSSVDNRTLKVFRMVPWESTYSYDTEFIAYAVYERTENFPDLIDPDIEYYKPTNSTYSTSYSSYIHIPYGYYSMQFANKGYGGYSYTLGTNVGITYSTSPAVSHGGPIGAFSGYFQIYDTQPGYIFYTINYLMRQTYSAVMALGWVYSGITMPLKSSGYRPLTPYANSTYTKGQITVYAQTGGSSLFHNGSTISINTTSYYHVYGTFHSSSTAVGNLSNTTALTKTATRYSSSNAVGNLSSITNLTRTTTRYSSSNAVGYLSSITNLTRTTTRYSSSNAVGNLSSITNLTRTTTRYSSSNAVGYLSSITALTRTATRYSSSTTVGNLSSTTELRTITRL